MDIDWGRALPLDRDEWGERDFAELLPPDSIDRRLDSLLPQDAETGVVTNHAFHTYLGAMMAMAARSQQPLSLLRIAIDDGPAVGFFGSEAAGLIGKAVSRCIRQETRDYDVVGLSRERDGVGLPVFMVVCPLLTEAQAASLAERLCAGMTASVENQPRPWLTVSIGVAATSIDAADPDALVARAASALRYARGEGGGRVWRHSDTLLRVIDARKDQPGLFDD